MKVRIQRVKFIIIKLSLLAMQLFVWHIFQAYGITVGTGMSELATLARVKKLVLASFLFK